MPAEIKIDDNYAVEESTVKITIAFTDENGDAAEPSSITWTLTDDDGTVINSRQDVVIDSPASSINVALTSDDLAFQTGETGDYEWRKFLVEWVYSSDLGGGLSGKDELRFAVYNLAAV